MSKPKADERTTDNPAPKSDAKVERVVYFIVLTAMTIVPLLAFLFSFGNVGDLGTSLGVDYRIAYLTGPGVDLFVTALNVGATWLSHRGKTEKELWPIHVLSGVCGLIMFALNCGPALNRHRYQLAAFDAVGPFLLIVMGLVGPWLLRQLAEVRQGVPQSGTVARTGTRPSSVPRPERAAPEQTPARPTTGPERTPGTAPTAVPALEPAKPERPSRADAPAVPTNTGTRTSSFEDWVQRAVPLFEAYLEKHGEKPTAPVLAARLRNTYPGPVPSSDRWERKLSAAVRKHLGLDEEADEESEAVAR